MCQLSSQTPKHQGFRSYDWRTYDWRSPWSEGNTCKHKRPAQILVVDDNRAEARLLVEVLKELQLPHQSHIAYSGEEAVDYLRQDSHDHPRPDMVLLDLHLPTLGGQEVLRLIKSDPALRAIPVVILTGSSKPEDFHASYASYANCCLQKPINFDELLELLGKISALWLGYGLP